MKQFLTALLLTVTVLGAQITREYTDQEMYQRRVDHDRVNRKMVEYWSRPDVLPTLPEGMKEKVEIYIKKFPEYQYKGSAGTSSTSKKTGPCITQ